VFAQLSRKGEGFAEIVKAAGGNANLASLLLVIEQMPKLVEEQAKAISNLKIDKITVWDSGSANGGKGSTADFVSSLVTSLPPLHELTKNVGIDLPEYLGKIGDLQRKPEEEDGETGTPQDPQPEDEPASV
jgi:flotillin